MVPKHVDRNYKLNTLDTVALEIFKAMMSQEGSKISLAGDFGIAEQQIKTAREIAKTFLKVAQVDTGYDN